MKKGKVIVLDIDGVILNSAFIFNEIFELRLKGEEMWSYFHENCNSDKVKLVNGFYDLYISLHTMTRHEGAKIILLTSRNESIRKETERKLRKEGVFYDELLMRPSGDYREANVLKKEQLCEIQKTDDVIIFIDDDLKNCEAAKELGIYSLRKV